MRWLRPIDDATLDAVLRWAPNESGDRALRFTPVGEAFTPPSWACCRQGGGTYALGLKTAMAGRLISKRS